MRSSIVVCWGLFGIPCQYFFIPWLMCARWLADFGLLAVALLIFCFVSSLNSRYKRFLYSILYLFYNKYGMGGKKVKFSNTFLKRFLLNIRTKNNPMPNVATILWVILRRNTRRIYLVRQGYTAYFSSLIIQHKFCRSRGIFRIGNNIPQLPNAS